jgi:large subunit ribosomal protein L10
MPKTRAQKAESMSALTQAFKAGKAAVFADFQGMSVQAVTGLRKKLHAEHVDYIVAKKTLMSRAAKDAGYEIDFKTMPGMLGVAIANEDEMAAARIVGEAASQKDATIKLVGGIFEGKSVDQEFVNKLSKLPSKPQLLTQLLWVLNGPIGGFARVLNAYKEEKEKGAPVAETPAPAAEPAPEAPKAEEAAPAPAEAPAAPEQPAA